MSEPTLNLEPQATLVVHHVVKHHPTLPPSSADAIMQCACFQADGEAGEAAEEGTRQHGIFARWNTKPSSVADDPDFREESNHGVVWAFNVVDGYRTQSPEAVVLVEEMVTVLNEDFATLTFGSLDVAVGNHLFDYKSGMKRSYRGQLLLYALGWMQTTGETECWCHILYGFSHDDEMFKVTLVEAELFAQQLATRRDNKDRVPEQCEYCPWCKHLPTCHASAGLALAVARSQPHEQPIKLWSMAEITDPKIMAQALAVADACVAWGEKIKDLGKKMVLVDEKAVPGWEKKSRAGVRKVTDVLALHRRAEGLDVTKLLSCCTVAVGKLEKVYVDMRPEGTKKNKAEEEFGKLFEGVVVRGPDVEWIQRSHEGKGKA